MLFNKKLIWVKRVWNYLHNLEIDKQSYNVKITDKSDDALHSNPKETLVEEIYDLGYVKMRKLR